MEKPQPMKRALRIVFGALVEVGDGAVGHHVVACTFAVPSRMKIWSGERRARCRQGDQDAVRRGDARGGIFRGCRIALGMIRRRVKSVRP